ncbi:MAG: heme-binding protein [Candidatus Nomurabacteria bacterium]
MNIILIIIVLITIWSIFGHFSSRVEQAEYSVIKKSKGYEIREYPSHIIAQTIIGGSYEDAMNGGFRIIAGYIFGDNTKKESIAMTAPVKEQKFVSEKIAMTAPVSLNSLGNSRVVSFVMPKSYSLETLPVPNDSRVKLVKVPSKKMAALRFSWSRNSNRINKMEKKLLSFLSRDKIETINSPLYAGYNAPWTPPWMTRNEIMIEIN